MAKKTKAKSVKKPWMAMNAGELAEATKQFDREIDLSETRPLSPENRKWWNKARKGGRPRVGKGSKPILITMEQGLLDQADAYAKKLGMNRSQLFAKGIESLLSRRAG
jgi:hypothetical protein